MSNRKHELFLYLKVLDNHVPVIDRKVSLLKNTTIILTSSLRGRFSIPYYPFTKEPKIVVIKNKKINDVIIT